MNFFEHQERARRKTARLVATFGLAVVGLVFVAYAVLIGILHWSSSGAPRLEIWSPKLFFQVAAFMLIVVGSASLYRVIVLSDGGRRVAESLGGRRIPPDTTEPDERRLLNVVEEMSIASGVPVPDVYLLETEKGINAFAAGYAPDDAVIGVTRGTIEQLDRDELQGVIAHEFSHVFNGDMRLNIRLLGTLFGITCLSTIGYLLLRASSYSRSSRGRGTPALLVMAGGGLLLVGWIGSFFAGMIRAAVSRQREFLADASAVQFTRYPNGLAGALRKIAAHPAHATLRSPLAADCSHMFFGAAVERSFMNLFATHPPIADRIAAIERRHPIRIDEELRSARGGAATRAGPGLATGFAPPGVSPKDVIESVGRPTAAHLLYASSLLRELDPAVHERIQDPDGARAVALALLLDAGDAAVRSRQVALIADDDAEAHAALTTVAPAVSALDDAERLPVLDLALPGLRRMSAQRYERFRDLVARVVRADRRTTLFEFALERVLVRHLDAVYRGAPKIQIEHRHVHSLAAECRVLLSALAHAGSEVDADRELAYDHGAGHLDWRGPRPAILPRSSCGVAELAVALDRIDAAAPVVKRDVIEACASVAFVDGHVAVEEAELLRAIAEGIDCPLPPFLFAEVKRSR